MNKKELKINEKPQSKKSTKACPNLISNLQSPNSNFSTLTSHLSFLTSDHKAITLIALVITIIVMLILVGVTVSVAINGGLFNTAKEAAKKTDIEAEREILGSYIATSLIKGYENPAGSNPEDVIGEKLYTRNGYNGEKWDIVYTDDAEYGTGWGYVAKGTDLGSYGKAKYNWVVNYETGEVEYLEEGEFTQLDFEDTVAIKDNLALNIDASNLKDEGSWDGIINHGGNDEEDKGVKYDAESNALVFDGEDDYLELTKPGDFSNGFTFEMYMNLDRIRYTLDGSNNACGGLFCKITSLENGNLTYAMRFRILSN